MTVAKPDIWMPLYVADYLADTAYLTTEQHGAYLLMLMAYWRNGAIPNDRRIIMSITKIEPDAWSIAQAVLEQFFTLENGKWVNKRLEQEYQSAVNRKKANGIKASNAANARWGNAPSNASSMPQALLEDMPQQCPSPSPIHKDQKHPPTPRKRGKQAAPAEGFDSFWLAYPKRQAKQDAVKAWAKIEPKDHAAIFAALHTSRWPENWRRDDGKYIPLPASWLNGRRWEDEAAVVAAQGLSSSNNWGCPPDVHPLELPAEDPRRIAFKQRGVVV